MLSQLVLTALEALVQRKIIKRVIELEDGLPHQLFAAPAQIFDQSDRGTECFRCYIATYTCATIREICNNKHLFRLFTKYAARARIYNATNVGNRSQVTCTIIGGLFIAK